MGNIWCNVRRPIPILVAKVWRRNLDYVINQVTSEIFYRRKYPDLRYIHHHNAYLQLIIYKYIARLHFYTELSATLPPPKAHKYDIIERTRIRVSQLQPADILDSWCTEED